MNILYINHYAGSPKLGMEYRPYYLSKEWVKLGHKVRILASTISHVRSHEPMINQKPILEITLENIDGIDYMWIPGLAYKGNGVGRVKNIFSFLYSIWKNTEKITSDFKPDVVIASSTYPMDIWVARHLAKKFKAKLVFELHDLWPLSPMELGGMSKWHPFIMLCQKAENDVYKYSDKVISILPKVHEHVKSFGFNLDKLQIIPNGIALEEWSLLQNTNIKDEILDSIKEAKKLGKTVVGYAGSVGLPNALNILVDAAKLLLMAKDQTFHFIIIGGGNEFETLNNRIQIEKISNINMYSSIPKSQIPYFLSLIDIAYIGTKKSSLYRFGISPNKLMDYMMSGCVVLQSIESGNDPVAEAQCGLTVQAESSTAVIEGLRSLSALSNIEKIQMKENGKRYVTSQLTYPVLAKKFLDFII